eukprot:gnl/MRDRNA2_/MRDRNA2_102724_c0_seq1.p1 gnl/MRDRNA2_/MRDRNA2_102724_c0~~gnl/MRDRNA2_/MRDRNA2_102724_c0_seq1.p1  ORF type:complete len:571 (-),score=102.89 gnl/MRDRNA2_/MRDRNA2_102724_c0_seq1:104-1732(-)
MSSTAAAWLHSAYCDWVLVIFIATHAAVLGFEMDDKRKWTRNGGLVLPAIKYVLAASFFIELCVRVVASGLKRWLTPLNILDAVSIAACVVEAVAISSNSFSMKEDLIFAVFRSLRILRLVHILLSIRRRSSRCAARMLSRCTMSAAKASLWSSFPLLALVYLSSLFTAAGLGSKDNRPELQKAFGSLEASLYTHCSLVTLAGFRAVMDLMQDSWLWMLYFVVFVGLISLGIANIVIGTVAACMLEISSTSSRCGASASEVASLLRVMEIAAKQAGVDAKAELGPAECKAVLDTIPMLQALSAIGSHAIRVHPDELFGLVGASGKMSMTMTELAEALLKVRGPPDTIHASLVQSRARAHEAEFDRLLKKMLEQLTAQHADCIANLQTKIQKKARDLHDASATAIHRIDPCTRCLHLIEQAEMKTESTNSALAQITSDLKASQERITALAARKASLNRTDSATQTYRWPPLKVESSVARQNKQRRSQSQPLQRPDNARHSSTAWFLGEELRHHSKFASAERWALHEAGRMSEELPSKGKKSTR